MGFLKILERHMSLKPPLVNNLISHNLVNFLNKPHRRLKTSSFHWHYHPWQPTPKKEPNYETYKRLIHSCSCQIKIGEEGKMCAWEDYHTLTKSCHVISEAHHHTCWAKRKSKRWCSIVSLLRAGSHGVPSPKCHSCYQVPTWRESPNFWASQKPPKCS